MGDLTHFYGTFWHFFQDIDFTIWGAGNKPPRVSSGKPRSSGDGQKKSDHATEKRRKLLPKKRDAQELMATDNNSPTNNASAQVVYVKFNFRRPRRRRQDSDAVSVDLSEFDERDDDGHTLTSPPPIETVAE